MRKISSNQVERKELFEKAFFPLSAGAPTTTAAGMSLQLNRLTYATTLDSCLLIIATCGLRKRKTGGGGGDLSMYLLLRAESSRFRFIFFFFYFPLGIEHGAVQDGLPPRLIFVQFLFRKMQPENKISIEAGKIKSRKIVTGPHAGRK